MINGQRFYMFLSILYLCTYNVPIYSQLKSRFAIYRDPVKIKRLAKLKFELLNLVEKLRDASLDKFQRDVLKGI